MGMMKSFATLSSLLAQTGFEFGPVFLPTTGAQDIAQGQHRIDMLFGPVHTGSLQACLDHQFVATLHHAASDRPTLRLKERILHLRFAFFQVG